MTQHKKKYQAKHTARRLGGVGLADSKAVRPTSNNNKRNTSTLHIRGRNQADTLRKAAHCILLLAYISVLFLLSSVRLHDYTSNHGSHTPALLHERSWRAGSGEISIIGCNQIIASHHGQVAKTIVALILHAVHHATRWRVNVVPEFDAHRPQETRSFRTQTNCPGYA